MDRSSGLEITQIASEFRVCAPYQGNAIDLQEKHQIQHICSALGSPFCDEIRTVLRFLALFASQGIISNGGRPDCPAIDLLGAREMSEQLVLAQHFVVVDGGSGENELAFKGLKRLPA